MTCTSARWTAVSYTHLFAQRAAGGLLIPLVLTLAQRFGYEIGYLRLKDRPVAGFLHIIGRHEGQEQVIVRAARAHAAAVKGMEPVHHVALLVLVRAAAQQVDAHGLRVGVDERQAVLQLDVYKRQGASRSSRSMPAAAAKCAAAAVHSAPSSIQLITTPIPAGAQ